MKVGLVVAPRGRLLMVLTFSIRDEKIVAIDAVTDPERLNQLDLTVLDDSRSTTKSLGTEGSLLRRS